MKKIILFSSFFFFILKCNLSFSQKKESFKWLVGQWKNTTSKNIEMEQWEQKADTNFIGVSLSIQKNKLEPQEIMEIVKLNNDWYFRSKVIGQNNNNTVSFKIIFLKGQEFICENLDHDFPQRISYRRIENKLFASIEGKTKDKFSKINFDFILE